MKVKLNLDELTYGDLELIESEIGYVPEDFSDNDVPRVKLTMVLAYISRRREDPSVTMDDIRAMKISELEIEEGEDPSGKDGSATSESAVSSS